MKKQVGPLTAGSKKSSTGPKLKLPKLPDGVRKLIGEKPVIRYSHQAALKIFETLGFRFEVRHLGESRLGLLRCPLRKMTPGTPVRRLVMVPGFGDTPLSWWSVLAGLKPILKRQVDEVVLVDYPGFSGFLHDDIAIDSMDELMRVFLEVVGSLKPEILVGHSLGAWLAADYAATAPDSLKKLILVDPGGLVTNAEDQATYRGHFTRALESGTEDLMPHLFKKAPLLLPLFEKEFFSFLSTVEVRDFIGSFGDRHLLNDKVANIRADTMILWGEHDTLTPTAWMDQWLALLPNDRKKTGILIRGCGHSPQIEKPGVMIALFTMIFLGREPKNLALLPFWKVLTQG